MSTRNNTTTSTASDVIMPSFSSLSSDLHSIIENAGNKKLSATETMNAMSLLSKLQILHIKSLEDIRDATNGTPPIANQTVPASPYRAAVLNGPTNQSNPNL